MSRITLHHKHGVAPALMFCPICGKDTNGIALLGARADRTMRELHQATDGAHGSSSGYQEYGHNKIPDSQPCDECKGHMEKGVLLISVRTGSQSNPYRTGRMCVVKPEAAKRIFPTIGESRMAFVEDEVWDKIGLPT